MSLSMFQGLVNGVVGSVQGLADKVMPNVTARIARALKGNKVVADSERGFDSPDNPGNGQDLQEQPQGQISLGSSSPSASPEQVLPPSFGVDVDTLDVPEQLPPVDTERRGSVKNLARFSADRVIQRRQLDSHSTEASKVSTATTALVQALYEGPCMFSDDDKYYAGVPENFYPLVYPDVNTNAYNELSDTFLNLHGEEKLADYFAESTNPPDHLETFRDSYQIDTITEYNQLTWNDVKDILTTYFGCPNYSNNKCSASNLAAASCGVVASTVTPATTEAQTTDPTTTATTEAVTTTLTSFVGGYGSYYGSYYDSYEVQTTTSSFNGDTTTTFQAPLSSSDSAQSGTLAVSVNSSTPTTVASVVTFPSSKAVSSQTGSVSRTTGIELTDTTLRLTTTTTADMCVINDNVCDVDLSGLSSAQRAEYFQSLSNLCDQLRSDGTPDEDLYQDMCDIATTPAGTTLALTTPFPTLPWTTVNTVSTTDVPPVTTSVTTRSDSTGVNVAIQTTADACSVFEGECNYDLSALSSADREQYVLQLKAVCADQLNSESPPSGQDLFDAVCDIVDVPSATTAPAAATEAPSTVWQQTTILSTHGDVQTTRAMVNSDSTKGHFSVATTQGGCTVFEAACDSNLSGLTDAQVQQYISDLKTVCADQLSAESPPSGQDLYNSVCDIVDLPKVTTGSAVTTVPVATTFMATTPGGPTTQVDVKTTGSTVNITLSTMGGRCEGIEQSCEVSLANYTDDQIQTYRSELERVCLEMINVEGGGAYGEHGSLAELHNAVCDVAELPPIAPITTTTIVTGPNGTNYTIVSNPPNASHTNSTPDSTPAVTLTTTTPRNSEEECSVIESETCSVPADYFASPQGQDLYVNALKSACMQQFESEGSPGDIADIIDTACDIVESADYKDYVPTTPAANFTPPIDYSIQCQTGSVISFNCTGATATDIPLIRKCIEDSDVAALPDTCISLDVSEEGAVTCSATIEGKLYTHSIDDEGNEVCTYGEEAWTPGEIAGAVVGTVVAVAAVGLIGKLVVDKFQKASRDKFLAKGEFMDKLHDAFGVRLYEPGRKPREVLGLTTCITMDTYQPVEEQDNMAPVLRQWVSERPGTDLSSKERRRALFLGTDLKRNNVATDTCVAALLKTGLGAEFVRVYSHFKSTYSLFNDGFEWPEDLVANPLVKTFFLSLNSIRKPESQRLVVEYLSNAVSLFKGDYVGTVSAKSQSLDKVGPLKSTGSGKLKNCLVAVKEEYALCLLRSIGLGRVEAEPDDNGDESDDAADSAERGESTSVSLLRTLGEIDWESMTATSFDAVESWTKQDVKALFVAMENSHAAQDLFLKLLDLFVGSGSLPKLEVLRFVFEAIKEDAALSRELSDDQDTIQEKLRSMITALRGSGRSFPVGLCLLYAGEAFNWIQAPATVDGVVQIMDETVSGQPVADADSLLYFKRLSPEALTHVWDRAPGHVEMLLKLDHSSETRIMPAANLATLYSVALSKLAGSAAVYACARLYEQADVLEAFQSQMGHANTILTPDMESVMIEGDSQLRDAFKALHGPLSALKIKNKMVGGNKQPLWTSIGTASPDEQLGRVTLLFLGQDYLYKTGRTLNDTLVDSYGSNPTVEQVGEFLDSLASKQYLGAKLIKQLLDNGLDRKLVVKTVALSGGSTKHFDKYMRSYPFPRVGLYLRSPMPESEYVAMEKAVADNQGRRRKTPREAVEFGAFAPGLLLGQRLKDVSAIAFTELDAAVQLKHGSAVVDAFTLVAHSELRSVAQQSYSLFAANLDLVAQSFSELEILPYHQDGDVVDAADVQQHCRKYQRLVTSVQIFCNKMYQSLFNYHDSFVRSHTDQEVPTQTDVLKVLVDIQLKLDAFRLSIPESASAGDSGFAFLPVKAKGKVQEAKVDAFRRLAMHEYAVALSKTAGETGDLRLPTDLAGLARVVEKSKEAIAGMPAADTGVASRTSVPKDVPPKQPRHAFESKTKSKERVESKQRVTSTPVQRLGATGSAVKDSKRAVDSKTPDVDASASQQDAAPQPRTGNFVTTANGPGSISARRTTPGGKTTVAPVARPDTAQREHKDEVVASVQQKLEKTMQTDNERAALTFRDSKVRKFAPNVLVAADGRRVHIDFNNRKGYMIKNGKEVEVEVHHNGTEWKLGAAPRAKVTAVPDTMAAARAAKRKKEERQRVNLKAKDAVLREQLKEGGDKVIPANPNGTENEQYPTLIVLNGDGSAIGFQLRKDPETGVESSKNIHLIADANERVGFRHARKGETPKEKAALRRAQTQAQVEHADAMRLDSVEDVVEEDQRVRDKLQPLRQKAEDAGYSYIGRFDPIPDSILVSTPGKDGDSRHLAVTLKPDGTLMRQVLTGNLTDGFKIAVPHSSTDAPVSASASPQTAKEKLQARLDLFLQAKTGLTVEGVLVETDTKLVVSVSKKGKHALQKFKVTVPLEGEVTMFAQRLSRRSRVTDAFVVDRNAETNSVSRRQVDPAPAEVRGPEERSKLSDYNSGNFETLDQVWEGRSTGLHTIQLPSGEQFVVETNKLGVVVTSRPVSKSGDHSSAAARGAHGDDDDSSSSINSNGTSGSRLGSTSDGAVVTARESKRHAELSPRHHQRQVSDPTTGSPRARRRPRRRVSKTGNSPVRSDSRRNAETADVVVRPSTPQPVGWKIAYDSIPRLMRLYFKGTLATLNLPHVDEPAEEYSTSHQKFVDTVKRTLRENYSKKQLRSKVNTATATLKRSFPDYFKNLKAPHFR